METPKLYVSTYVKYNNGSLKGAWLDLTEYPDRETFLEACKELHADESDPELMFQDFEGFPKCWYDESSAPPDILWEWLEMDEDEQTAFAIFAKDNHGEATVDDFREAYQGTYDTPIDFCEQLADDLGAVSPHNAHWIVIDWEATWNCNLRHDYWYGQDSECNFHFFRRI